MNSQKNWNEYQGDDRVISSHELGLLLSAQKTARVSVKSLMPTLDRWTGGFEGGELIVISGPTKNGKTLLAQSLTVNFEKQDQPSLWFSFEVPARQFLLQFPEIPCLYMPAKLKPHALDWLEDRIVESFQKYRTRIVCIDHLHYLLDIARMRTPSIEIGAVVRRLKGIAVNREIVIFLLCHTVKGKQDGTLSYESIRDSSFVSQESDTVLMVKRTPENGDNAARLRVEFHRRTGALEQVVELVKVGGLLHERTHDRPAMRERADIDD